MPRPKIFFLDEQRTQVITVTWQGNYKNVQVTHNGHLLTSFPDKNALQQGGSFTLYDGSRLDIYLKTERMGTGLCVDHNGKPLKGSFNHPDSIFGLAAGGTGMAAFFTLLVAVFAAVSGFGLKEVQEYWWVFAVLCVALLASGMSIPYTRSVVMVHATILFLIANIAWLFYFSVLSTSRIALAGAVINVMIILAVSRAYGAIRTIAQADQK